MRVAFANSMSVVWKTMAGIAGLGLLSVLLLKEVPLKTSTDTKFALDDVKRNSSAGESTTSDQKIDVLPLGELDGRQHSMVQIELVA